MSKCHICPRDCGADRESGALGFCGAPYELQISKIMLHSWEEPCISGKSGAGTVFFSGCSLHCLYCQNIEISRGGKGKIYSKKELEYELLSLQDKGAEVIEFVTPTHYTDTLASLLEDIKQSLNIPVVWNSGGYEKPESLRLLRGLVDIYLPDCKYIDSESAKNYSSAEDYSKTADLAISEMLLQQPKLEFDKNGMLKKGVMVRHLVLPSHRKESIMLLEHIKELFGSENILLSLMSQYTPDFYVDAGCPGGFRELARRLTSFEYESVKKKALSLGFDGYFQELSSAKKEYTPDFK